MLSKCEDKFIGAWSGNTYVCSLKGVHLYHKGYDKEGDVMEWANREQFCGQPFPNTNDLCKRPPNHKGYCRVKVHGRSISFKLGAR